MAHARNAIDDKLYDTARDYLKAARKWKQEGEEKETAAAAVQDEESKAIHKAELDIVAGECDQKFLVGVNGLENKFAIGKAARINRPTAREVERSLG